MIDDPRPFPAEAAAAAIRGYGVEAVARRWDEIYRAAARSR